MFPFFAALSASTIMGIDLGGAYIKASVATATQTLHMALNIHGKRYMPFQFSFWNRTRASNHTSLNSWNEENLNSYDFDFGFFAKDQCLRFPKTCVSGLPNLTENYFGFKGYEILALELDSFVKSVRKAENIQDNIQLVVTAPPGMDPRDKSFIRIACAIAKLDLLQIIDQTTAPAYTYSLERRHIYENISTNVAFVDVGATGTRVSIFNFNSTEKNQNEINQLSVTFNNTIGGNTIDEELAKILAEKYNVDMSNLKTRVNFINDVSAGKEALAMHPSVDLKWESDDDIEERIIKITREDLEKASKVFNETVVELAKNSLIMANLTKVDRVELNGGGSRAIFLRDPLKEIFNVDDISRALNQDNANALGAGYAAAEMSPQFTVFKTNKTLMITTPSYATAGTHAYPIFQRGDDEAGSPSIQTKCSEKSRFSIISQNGEFTRFAIENVKEHENVEIQYIHNYMLMPVPYSCVRLSDGKELPIKMIDLPWEPTKESINKSSLLIEKIIDLQDKRRLLHKAANELEEFLLQLKHVCEERANDNTPINVLMRKLVKENLEWYEGLTYEPKEEEYRNRLNYLHKELDQSVDELLEVERKPKAIKKLRKTISGVKELLAAAGLSPTINQTELAIARESSEEAEKKLKEFEDNGTHSKEIVKERLSLKEAVLPVRKFMRKQEKKPADDSKLSLM